MIRVINIDKWKQLNEQLAACIENGDLEGADKLDAELMRMVGTHNRVVYQRGVMPPVLTYLYAFNHAMVMMNHGYVQEGAFGMVDVMETLFFGSVQEHIYCIFDRLVEMRGKRNQFAEPHVLACDYLLMAVLCQRRFPAMSLSFFWKSHMLFKKLGDVELEKFTHAFVKVQYGLVAVSYDKLDPEGAKIFNEAADKITDQLKIPARTQTKKQLAVQEAVERMGVNMVEERPVQKPQSDEFAKGEHHLIDAENDAKLEELYPSFDANVSLLTKRYGQLDEKDKEHLPNILEVMELVCYDEERYAALYDNTNKLTYVFGMAHERDGIIDAVVNSEGKIIHFPKGLVKNLFYRGQTQKHSPCYPSLYRNLTDQQRLVERVKLCEFSLLLHKHPSAQLFEDGMFHKLHNGEVEHHSLHIDEEALAQHYGIKTEYLDVTVDKWVAAFFACCDYHATAADEHDDYVKHTNDHTGVFYRYQDTPQYESDAKFRPIGMQPHSRPVLQAGYVLKLEPKQDFDTMATVIPFRFDPRCVGILYWLFNQSGNIQPKELFGLKAKQIVSEKNTFSAAALAIARQRYYRKLTDEQFAVKVADYHLKSQPEPLVDIAPDKMQQLVNERQLWEPYLWHRTRAKQIVELDLDNQ